MAMWFIIVISLCISYVVSSILSHFRSSTKLPPGPPSIPIISTFLWLRTSNLQLESYLRTAVAKYGTIVTLRRGSRLSIFIADHSIAHKILVQNGALFSGRPPAQPVSKLLTSNQHSISSASYGPLWRLLRRNLTSQILHASRVKSYNRARKGALDNLLNRLVSYSKSETPVTVIDHFHYAMFCLLVLMCFGDRLDEPHIREIMDVERAVVLSYERFNVLNFWPKFTKILLRKRWQTLLQLRKNQEDVIIPLIEARRKANQNRGNRETEQTEKLTNEEIVTICSEFLNAGTDTTSTALQWIMANLVKYPEIQHKAFCRDKRSNGDRTGEEVKEDDLRKLPYLKAVVLEGLRRHPPGHFVLPHAVKEETELENYVIPKYGTVDFMVAEMGWDPKVWEDPAAFMPERFLKGGKEEEEEVSEFDITGSKEIKMMPFGAGRRICPGFGLAILHLEYFLANLVWRSEWKAVEGDEVDLSEKLELTVVMKKPLKARIYSRG
ncbi:Cytochrome P450 89A2, partial [Cucurbita argyrosperma subsp. sororia]